MTRTIRIPAAALAALSTALVAACSDAPSAPAAPAQAALAPGETPSQALILTPIATLTLTLPQIANNPAIQATVRFTSFTGSRGVTVREVADNSADDLDKTPGLFKVQIAKSAKYEARVTAVYASLWNYEDAVRTMTSTSQTVNLGSIVFHDNPWIAIRQHDGFATGVPVAGGAYMVSRNGQNLKLVEDDVVNDSDAAAGAMRFIVPGTGSYTLCETKAPAGYKPLSPSCFQVTTGTWGTTVSVPVVRVKL